MHTDTHVQGRKEGFICLLPFRFICLPFCFVFPFHEKLLPLVPAPLNNFRFKVFLFSANNFLFSAGLPKVFGGEAYHSHPPHERVPPLGSWRFRFLFH
jgi:hypothetical protein